MNNFFDEELVDQRGTITFEKRRKFREGVENFIDGKLNDERIIREAYRNEEEVLKEELNMSIYDRFKEDEEVSYLNESTEVLAEGTEDLFVDILCETVIRALNIDSELVEDNREQITDKVKGVYTAFQEEINFEGSQVVVDLVTKCRECATTFDIDKHDSLYETADAIAMIVKEKVARVIEEEKTMSKLEIMREENEYNCSVDIKLTLFKEMEIENVKQAIQECGDRENITKENLLLMSFYETVVDYTLLETLNTLRMIEFNNEMYRDTSRRRLRECEIKDI